MLVYAQTEFWSNNTGHGNAGDRKIAPLSQLLRIKKKAVISECQGQKKHIKMNNQMWVQTESYFKIYYRNTPQCL